MKRLMLQREIVKVPTDRVGVIVGRNGRVRKRVEEMTNTKIEISADGMVIITTPPSEETEDPVLVWKARDMIRAMGRGFSPKRALSLIDDDARLIIISLRDVVGSSPSQMKRVAGRLIGEGGRTRRVIEETTECKVSVYGKTVSIIGAYPGLDHAQRAIMMLVEGAPHSAVYAHLERMRREMNRQRTELWEDSP